MKIREEEFLAEIQKKFYVNHQKEFVEAMANLLLIMIKDMHKPTIETGSYRVQREDADYFMIQLRMKEAIVFMEYRIIEVKDGFMLLEYHELDIWD